MRRFLLVCALFACDGGGEPEPPQLGEECTPIYDPCGAGLNCVLVDSQARDYACQAIDPEPAQEGEPCFAATCDAGLACMGSCSNLGPGCCYAFCELDDPLGCASGKTCTSWQSAPFPNGVGVCE